MSHVFIDGHLVSQRISQVVQAIQEYEPEIEVQWIPPEARTEGSAAFRIMHNVPGGASYPIFFVQTEEEFDGRVLQKIIKNDQRHGKQTLGEFEAFEEAKRLVDRQAMLDQLEELAEITASVLRSPKDSYKVHDGLIFRNGVPFNAANLES